MTDAPPGTAAQSSAQGQPAARPSTLLLCLSHLRWNFVFQRPQHLLTRAARGYEVLFVEEPIFHPGISPRMDLNRTPQGVTVAVPLLPEGLTSDAVIAAQRSLLDELLAPEAGRPMVVWFYTPMALEFAGHLNPDLTVYDCMDELSAFRGAPPRMLELERALLARADLVFTGGRSLYEAKRNRHPKVSCFPSSIDTAHYAAARAGQADPEDQADIPHPRIGFFGVIDERMDAELVGALAAARPDWQFVMIGPVVKIDPAALPRLSNIHWLGGRQYAELPRYLGGWDAGFMPFAQNESTRFISPTKTPEFLAAGLPVVSTPITDVVRDWGPKPDGTAGLVEIAEEPVTFAAALQQVLERPRAPWLKQVDRRLAQMSWDQTWAEMDGQIEAGLRAATLRQRPAADTTLRRASHV
ncbi:glycosyltransferase family 1 protein [Belnapia sp. T6]|uniref:Glycosyltransferase family 1 protein n=1 Tax=Belnapia mucosa TaxID=2804532 RepID=A0ABS1UZQ8_9PROT|nr:glycosyltransferase family 1 protein [Belnapia mucosa]MBL6454934.1 glycosyltransferase family 1 protein [Belnapia mucosa]